MGIGLPFINLCSATPDIDNQLIGGTGGHELSKGFDNIIECV